ncbi:DUF6484 domain-containing protein [Enhygromyxa salina]|uniref:DUF6484 domain-containing protein n=1 Tax=Enhygromyxa salina TaxID=215803 RepID=A0A2S9YQ73_9BACT|nr:DUF6484 domain-containing protein [Enhygromyxa salina]PRQ07237.1 hypothetical protein ENSA7_29440 [Enhygromyxa salina]
MPDGSVPRPDAAAAAGVTTAQACLGRVVSVDADGRPRVWFAGLSGPPPVARLIGVVPPASIEDALLDGRTILLGFLDGRADAPVIMSLASMADLPRCEPPVASELPATPEPEPEPEPEIKIEVDGEASERVIEAREQLVLRCGDAAITLRADGTVRIVGRDITSWARRRQRIRGGSVAIN